MSYYWTGLTTGIEKPGWLLSPQRNQIKSFNFAPPSHSSPANYFPIHPLFHMLTGHRYSSSPTLCFTLCLFHLSIHPSWKCLLATQNRFQHWFCFCLVYWFQSNSEMLSDRELWCCTVHYPQLRKGGRFDWYRWETRTCEAESTTVVLWCFSGCYSSTTPLVEKASALVW